MVHLVILFNTKDYGTFTGVLGYNLYKTLLEKWSGGWHLLQNNQKVSILANVGSALICQN